ncbi:hypothetical protein V6U90_10550 [Micromonospora sp. CPCC 206060]|uniref:hypothetical protein n=1 Tax=Micromonospora sp. CPCC 206060 TaxID=3122406 RepID=UPI002FEE752C
MSREARFAFDSPDSLDIGLALYDLHGRVLRPRPGTPAPAPAHVDWHRREVFKGRPLAAQSRLGTDPG